MTAAIWRTGWYQLHIPRASFTSDGRVRLILSRCCAVIGQRSIRLNKLPATRENDKRGSFLLREMIYDRWSRAAFPLTACGKSRRSEVERIEANKIFGGEPTTRFGQKTASRCIGEDDKYHGVEFGSGSIDAGFRDH